MELRVILKPNAPGLAHFSAEKLNAISESFTFTLEPGVEFVFFGENPPFDLKKRWQKLDSYGAYVGMIKTYNGTAWV